ncbi:MAG: hypothetical protein L0G82_04305 [Pseudomonas sp.]|nr:hypothetical protein [Pseudomonas sp.]
MSLELKKDEIQAWDHYAAVALKAVIDSRPIDGKAAAQTAALVADCLIEERRKRVRKPTSAVGML